MKKLDLKELGLNQTDILSHEEKKRIFGGGVASVDCWSNTYMDCYFSCPLSAELCDYMCAERADFICDVPIPPPDQP